jgi:hypothetical protein
LLTQFANADFEFGAQFFQGGQSVPYLQVMGNDVAQ